MRRFQGQVLLDQLGVLAAVRRSSTFDEHFAELLCSQPQPEWISPGGTCTGTFQAGARISEYVREGEPFTKSVGLGKASNAAWNRWESDNL